MLPHLLGNPNIPTINLATAVVASSIVRFFWSMIATHRSPRHLRSYGKVNMLPHLRGDPNIPTINLTSSIVRLFWSMIARRSCTDRPSTGAAAPSTDDAAKMRL